MGWDNLITAEGAEVKVRWHDLYTVSVPRNFHQICPTPTVSMESNNPTHSVSAFICVHRRFIFIYSTADKRRCGYGGFEACVHAQAACSTIRRASFTFSFHAHAVQSFFQTLIYTDSELLLHKLYILTAMAEPHQSPMPPPASQNTCIFIIFFQTQIYTDLRRFELVRGSEL